MADEREQQHPHGTRAGADHHPARPGRQRLSVDRSMGSGRDESRRAARTGRHGRRRRPVPRGTRGWAPPRRRGRRTSPGWRRRWTVPGRRGGCGMPRAVRRPRRAITGVPRCAGLRHRYIDHTRHLPRKA
jgi:hypothetical protein